MSLIKLKNKLSICNKILDIYFLCTFSCYYFYIFLGTTMIDTKWFVPFYRLSVIAIAFLIPIKMLTITRKSIKEWFVGFVIVLCCGFCWLSYGDKSILILGMFILGAMGVSFRKIVQTSILIGSTIMIVAFFASQLGYIEDLVYFIKGTYRHAFGVSYTTDFAAHVLFLVLAYCFLKEGKLEWFEHIIILFLTMLIFIYCRAKTNVICLILTVISLFFINIKKLYLKKHKMFGKIYDGVKKLMVFSMPICAGIMILLTWGYQENNHVWSLLNGLLSGRLSMGHEGLMRYGLTLFGKPLVMMGYGRTTKPPDFYFAIDSSYILILLSRGLILFGIICAIFTFCGWRCYRQGQDFILILLTIIAIQSMIEHHLLDISYNFFLLFLFARWDYNLITRNVPEAVKQLN